MIEQKKILKEISYLINKINDTKNEEEKVILLQDICNLSFILKTINDKANLDIINNIFINNKEIIKKLNLNYKYSTLSFWNDYFNNKELLKELSLSIIKTINKETDNKSVSLYNVKKFNNNESKNIIYDFINEYDSSKIELTKNTLENYFTKTNQSNLNNNMGITINISDINKSYILIKDKTTDKNNILDLEVIVHELGHVFSNNIINQNMTFNRFTNLLCTSKEEIPSFTLQTLFRNYCIEKDIDKENVQKIQTSSLYNLSNLFLNLGNDIFTNNKDVNNYKIKYVYSIGQYFAYLFMQMYKDNPTYMKQNFNKFINNMGITNDYDIFNNYGFNKDEILSGKILKK